MAVIITDHRTIINEADAVTGWTGASALFTADPDPVEATGSIGTTVSTATADAYFTTTAQNLSDALVYVWVQPNGTMDTLTNGGTGIHLGDGTNRISLHTQAVRYDGLVQLLTQLACLYCQLFVQALLLT